MLTGDAESLDEAFRGSKMEFGHMPVHPLGLMGSVVLCTICSAAITVFLEPHLKYYSILLYYSSQF